MYDDPPKRLRGFAAMSPERRREISRKGGASHPPEARSFSRDRDLAAAAGAKGGAANKAPRAFGRDRELASRAGATGGKAGRGEAKAN